MKVLSSEYCKAWRPRTLGAMAMLATLSIGLTGSQPLGAQGSGHIPFLDYGGFELGTPHPNWDEASLSFGTPICCIDTDEGPDLKECTPSLDCGTGLGTAGPRSGDWWAWMGGFPGAEASSLKQIVAFPRGHAKKLELWLWHGAASGNPQDTLQIWLGEKMLYELDGTSEPSADYVLLEFELKPEEDGGPLPLLIECETFGYGVSNYSIDDLVIHDMLTPAEVDIPALGPLSFTLLALFLALCGAYRLRG